MGLDQVDGGGEGGGRRRRRRRRRRGPGEGVEPMPVVTESAPVHEEEGPGRPRRGRRLVRDEGDAPGVSLPSTGKTVFKPRVHRKKWKPAAGLARRRRLSRTEIDDLVTYFQRMPEHLLSALYRAMGGQPSRVPDMERMTQLTVRAIAQGSRLGVLLNQMHQRDRQALLPPVPLAWRASRHTRPHHQQSLKRPRWRRRSRSSAAVAVSSFVREFRSPASAATTFSCRPKQSLWPSTSASFAS